MTAEELDAIAVVLHKVISGYLQHEDHCHYALVLYEPSGPGLTIGSDLPREDRQKLLQIAGNLKPSDASRSQTLGAKRRRRHLRDALLKVVKS